uniref:ACP_syn_III_C domain-containing protein n=1 Tax=Steinernema glaseri TaxID=37863 RepID=A0A1I7YFJ6_9BILA
MDKAGILDPQRMKPRLPERSNDEPSILCQMGVAAAEQALARAGRTAADVDAVIVACSNLQRPYPAIAIEVQQALGIAGFGFDMNPLHLRHAATAVLVERADLATSAHQFDIVSTKLLTQFSNNIRNNFGFLNRAAEEGIGAPDKLFVQEGRKVFREVCPMVAELIGQHLSENNLNVSDVKRFWLHQANLSMNHLIVKKLLGRDALVEEAPVILDTYANTSSAGSVIALHKHQDDLPKGALGVLSSFGAGYSIGSVILRKR